MKEAPEIARPPESISRLVYDPQSCHTDICLRFRTKHSQVTFHRHVHVTNTRAAKYQTGTISMIIFLNNLPTIAIHLRAYFTTYNMPTCPNTRQSHEKVFYTPRVDVKYDKISSQSTRVLRYGRCANFANYDAKSYIMYAAHVPKRRVQSVGMFSLTLAIFVAATRVATRVAKSKNKITRESFVVPPVRHGL